ncbi:hypothetical protein [Streptomyces sp. NPDC001833]|uniref:hypothetical protein n=1 Tax=Streptomyces sp. NPDC001833 TaxID=3154658 RepID=UPI00331E9F8E
MQRHDVPSPTTAFAAPAPPGAGAERLTEWFRHALGGAALRERRPATGTARAGAGTGVGPRDSKAGEPAGRPRPEPVTTAVPHPTRPQEAQR